MNKQRYYWNCEGNDPILILSGIYKEYQQKDSIQKLVDSLSENIKLFEKSCKNLSSKKEGLFNLLLSIFPNKNSSVITQTTSGTTTFPLELKLNNTIIEQRTLLKDLITNLGNNDVTILKSLFNLLINFIPPDLAELLNIAKFQDSMICTYFTIYFSIILNICELKDIGIIYEKKDLDLNQRSWLEKFISEIDCIIEYFENVKFTDFEGGNIHKDCLMLMFVLIFYLILTILGIDDNKKKNYKNMVYRLIRIQVYNIKFNYWYFKILIHLIEIIGFEVYTSEALDIILKYQHLINKQMNNEIEETADSPQKMDNYEIHTIVSLCKKWINKNITLKKQLILLIEKSKLDESVIFGVKNNYLSDYIHRRIDDFRQLDPVNIIFINLTQLFCIKFGVSILGFKNEKLQSLFDFNLSYANGLPLVDILNELLLRGDSIKFDESILFDSTRLFICTLTILINSGNFENKNWGIQEDIIGNDIFINSKYEIDYCVKILGCYDLIERLFVIIANLIMIYKTDQKLISNSFYSMSSISSMSINSVIRTTTIDISLFLLIWNNYISIFNSYLNEHRESMINNSIQLSLIYLVNKKYKLDVLCEITFFENETKDDLPMILDKKYCFITKLLIDLWRCYLNENPELLTQAVVKMENIFTVPNINYFFKYLNIIEETIMSNIVGSNSHKNIDDIKFNHKIDSNILELMGIVSSVLIIHKIDSIPDKYNTLMAILSASENPKIMIDYIYRQVSVSLQIDGAYIYNCLKFFRDRWNSNTKIQVFSLLSDMYISLMKPSLFQFLQCLISNFTEKGGIFEKSFSLFKVRGMRGIILDEDYEILQFKLTDMRSYSNSNLKDAPLLRNEIFFGCYSIDLYYTINNIQKGWQSPSLSMSTSSPRTFLNKKRHSSLIITDSEDVYALINKLNPLFDQLINDSDYLKLFINTVGELTNVYFHFLFGKGVDEIVLREQILKFSVTFGVQLLDENLMTCINLENEMFKDINRTGTNTKFEEETITDRLNYKFYSQLIIRMIYLCTWLIVDNDNGSYYSLSEICVEKILNGLLGFLYMEDYSIDTQSFNPNDHEFVENHDLYLDNYDFSLSDNYILEHYTRFVCTVWSLLSSLNPQSILKYYIEITEKKDFKYYQLYILIILLIESSEWFIDCNYFQYLDLWDLIKKVELMTNLSVCYSRDTNQFGHLNSEILDVSSSLHINILFVFLVLKSITVERSEEAVLEYNKKKHLNLSRIQNQDTEISQIKINTFNNKWIQRDAYVNGGRSMINYSNVLSNHLLPYLWSFYENYPTYKDVYAKLLQSKVQLTTFMDNLCMQLYDKKHWNLIMKNFNCTVSDSLIDIFDNRLLSYNQFIVIEYIWEYYINNNTMCSIEKYISAIIYSIYNTKKINFFDSWLLLSFWKRYPSRLYKSMMRWNNTWIVSYIMDHLFHYALLIRLKNGSSNQELRIFQNIELENLFSFLLYHYHPQHYHDRMSSKYFWYNVSSEQGYLNKINAHNVEIKSLVVNSKYIKSLSNTQFHDYFHYIGHVLPFSVIIYLLSNQFSSEKKKFISNSHHFHNYFHHNLYTSTVVVWSCIRSLMFLEETDWELLLLQYIEIIKSNKRNNHLMLTCLLDMALKSTKFAQILCIYTNNPNSSILTLLQKCLFIECDFLSTNRTYWKGNVKSKKKVEKIDGSDKNIVINKLRSVKDDMETLTSRLSSISSLINKRINKITNCMDSKIFIHDATGQQSLANLQFSFLYILCQLGEMVKYRYRREVNIRTAMEDPSVVIGRLNSRERALLKSEIAQDLLNMIEGVTNRKEYKNAAFINVNMLKSSHLELKLLSIKSISKLKILQSAKNIPYLLSLQLINDCNNKSEANESFKKNSAEELQLTINLIVKCNDDCRQDVITMQYISVFQRIFQLYNIPVWLYPYRVLPMMFKDINNTVVYGGIIEFIEDSISLHEIHERHPEGGLKEYFEKTFVKHSKIKNGNKVSYEQARYNFIASLAGYSIACYVLQIKDRHNGNILITNNGHIIHIDYGFIFDISPGNNLHFERAAFKITQEMLDLMDDQVDLFDDLCLSGFLAVREHSDLLLSLTQLLLNSGIPCFRGETIKKLKERLLLNFPQQQASNIFSKKIHSAHNHITTKGYDLVQFIQQGIK